MSRMSIVTSHLHASLSVTVNHEKQQRLELIEAEGATMVELTILLQRRRLVSGRPQVFVETILPPRALSGCSIVSSNYWRISHIIEPSEEVLGMEVGFILWSGFVVRTVQVAFPAHVRGLNFCLKLKFSVCGRFFLIVEPLSLRAPCRKALSAQLPQS